MTHFLTYLVLLLACSFLFWRKKYYKERAYYWYNEHESVVCRALRDEEIEEEELDRHFSLWLF